MILRKPIFWPAVKTKTVEITTIRRNGAHQAALRRRSVKVFEGAMKVLRMRAPSESGAGCEVGLGTATGVTGAAAMMPSCEESEGILVVGGRRDKGKSSLRSG